MKLKKTLLISLFSFIFVGNVTNAKMGDLELTAAFVYNQLGECKSFQGDKKAQCMEKIAKEHGGEHPIVIAMVLYDIGTMYIGGDGVKQDFKKAFYWLQKSAKAGESRAQSLIGSMYYSGKGTKQDYQKALYWHKKAAEQGQASSMSELGMMYMMGEGVKQNDKQAVYWFEKACSAGDQKICQLINNAKPR